VDQIASSTLSIGLSASARPVSVARPIDDAVRQLHEEWLAQQTLFQSQPASVQRFLRAQATEWRDVAIGEIPEVIIFHDKRGTFTRSVTITFVVAVLIMLLVRGQTTVAAPFYGVGVFMPIMVMGLAVRQHFLQNYKGRARAWADSQNRRLKQGRRSTCSIACG
jgi:hypothetical protein